MGWQLISHQSAPTSNQFDFTGLSLSGYQRLILLVDGLTVGTDATFVLLRLSTGGTLRTSGYRWRNRSLSTGGTIADSSSAADTSIRLVGATDTNFGVGNAAGKSWSGKIEIGNLTTALYKLVTAEGVCVGPTGQGIRQIVGGHLEQTGTLDGVRVLLSGGTMPAGKATLYGLTTS